MEKILFLPVLLPLLCGLFMFLKPFKERKARNIYVFCVTVLTGITVFALVLGGGEGTQQLLRLDSEFSLAFRMDGLSRVFALIVSVLWPLAVLYSFEYMSFEKDENRFFAFYTITYGVVMGIAEAENYFTLYLFYELLTLATLPLVMHEMDGKARFAGKRYILYSMSGAALSFIAMVLAAKTGSLSYVPGGTGDLSGKLAQTVFLLGFFGFGVKAALVPLHAWLPTAGVAPTPVTALLHAVAVVNSGLFAVMRLIYYFVGTKALSGTAAQSVAMGFACLTIVYGSLMALRNRNLKRRLAYSTVSNLSYILFAATLMCPAGLASALLHMTVHSATKIILFFCAGALLCATRHQKRNIEDYEGYGKKLPLLFGAFAVASLALIGVPPMGGFTSKWMIAKTAAAVNTPLSWVGVAALCISAFLTGLYLLGVLIPAFWPTDRANVTPDSEVHKNGWQINFSLILLTVLLLLVSAFSREIYAAFSAIAENV